MQGAKLIDDDAYAKVHSALRDRQWKASGTRKMPYSSAIVVFVLLSTVFAYNNTKSVKMTSEDYGGPESIQEKPGLLDGKLF